MYGMLHGRGRLHKIGHRWNQIVVPRRAPLRPRADEGCPNAALAAAAFEPSTSLSEIYARRLKNQKSLNECRGTCEDCGDRAQSALLAQKGMMWSIVVKLMTSGGHLTIADPSQKAAARNAKIGEAHFRLPTLSHASWVIALRAQSYLPFKDRRRLRFYFHFELQPSGPGQIQKTLCRINEKRPRLVRGRGLDATKGVANLGGKPRRKSMRIVAMAQYSAVNGTVRCSHCIRLLIVCNTLNQGDNSAPELRVW